MSDSTFLNGSTLRQLHTASSPHFNSPSCQQPHISSAPCCNEHQRFSNRSPTNTNGSAPQRLRTFQPPGAPSSSPLNGRTCQRLDGATGSTAPTALPRAPTASRVLTVPLLPTVPRSTYKHYLCLRQWLQASSILPYACSHRCIA